ncbi:MAG TPA: hypothetical protein DGT21_01190 [Armatimonadetes bacterium]|jgi:hypothetical protein|nr:hypothetical protein [Armatimonadota bacterium]
MEIRELLTAVLLVLIPALPLAAADYFVSPTGDDAGAGSRERPWLTIAKANATLQPGDTVTFLDGEYAGVIEPANSGTEGMPITYRAENRLGAVITGGQSSDGMALCARLKEREHIVIDGFMFLPTAGGWMQLDAANYCIIRNCRMENATRSGSPIKCTNCHYNRYEDLQCWRANNTGVWGHVSGDLWNNFASSHNIFLRVHISRAGHRPFGQWFDCEYNVIRGCIFDCRWGRNFEFFSTPRLLVEQCIITNGFDGSGSADGRAKLFIIDSIFRRNVIYRNHYGPLVINAYKYEDLPTFGMMRSRLYHNTWYRNHEYGYEMVDNGDQNPDPHYVTGNIFQNNIFSYNDPGGDGLSLALYSNIAENNEFNHNLLYGDKPGCKTIRYDWVFPGLTEWKGLAMSAEEANELKPRQFRGNIDAEPGFLDPEADDYRLRPDSPCIDAGKPLARVTREGQGREVAVDDARWFYDGFGIPGEVGDLVFIGQNKTQARVTRTDIDTNTLALDRDITCARGDGVYPAHVGEAPDLGAYEVGAEARDWYAAPVIPDGLRIETMETATKPVVVTDFEIENLEQWHYYWNFSRQKNTDARIDDTTAGSGVRSMRIFATGDGAIMSCDIRPRWWDIDRFPTVRLSYRIPEGVPVGLWLHAFRSSTTGRGAVCIGGTAARATGSFPHIEKYTLIDDDRWHEIVLDARTIREAFPQVKLLQMFRFYTVENGAEGQQYWFDSFSIEPEA